MRWLARHGFALEEELHRGRHASVLRCRSLEDDQPVIIKVAEAHLSGALGAARVRHEHRILTRLLRAQTPHLLPAPSLRLADDITALVWPDIGVRPVPTEVPLARAVSLGLRVAEALMTVHNAGVIHKDISPYNILYDPQHDRVALIDFDASSEMARELQGSGGQPEGSLPYTSPEQTGRINRLLDYRTDLYALGATLYHWLAGRPLFSADHPVELVHAILARQPPQLTALNPKVPPFLAAVVHTLVAKDPEERYQSAYGLHADLQRCLELTQGKADAAHWRVAEHDRNERFVLPQRLYGRTTELRTLTDALERVRQGSAEWVLVSGPSGVGKSALVGELQAAVAKTGGLFAVGKYDRLRRHVPLSALGHAAGVIVRHLLSDDASAVDAWRDRVQAAMGGVGQALVATVPALEALVGKQPPLADLPSRENAHRLVNLWQRFLAVLSERQPVVLVLDDLQWIDGATVQLLRLMAAAPSAGARLLLVGCFRDDEVAGKAEHPLTELLAQLEAEDSPTPVLRLPVVPLSLQSVADLVADTTHGSPERVQALAAALQAKTAGNPFHVRAFLQHLHDRGALRYDVQAGAWQWDLAQVQAVEATDNVIALLTLRLHQLPAAVLEILGVAACVGNEFLLSLVCACTTRTHGETAQLLLQAASEGIILPLQGSYRYAEHLHEDVLYRFVHDQVQHAAHALVPAELATLHHLRIGKALQQRLSPDAATAFAVADHLNRAGPRMQGPARAELLELNLRAHREATRASAHAVALAYAAAAVALLPEDAWQAQRLIALRTTLALADSQLAAGEGDAANQSLTLCQAHAEGPLERAEVLHRRAVAWFAQGELVRAATTAQEGLALLRVRLRVTPAGFMHRLMRIRWHLRRRSVEALLSAPALQDRRWEVVLELLDALALATFVRQPRLWRLCALEVALIVLEHGHSRFSASGYSRLAILMASLNDYPMALRLSSLCPRLEQELPCEQVRRSWTWHRRLAHVEHVSLPLSAFMAHLGEAADVGLETGDSLHVGWNLILMQERSLASSLAQNAALEETYADFFAQRAEPLQRRLFVGLRALRTRLTGQASPADEAQAGNARMFLVNKLAVLVILRDLDGAVELAQRPRLLQGLIDSSVHLACIHAGLALTQHTLQHGGRQLPRGFARAFARFAAKVEAAALNGQGVLAGAATLLRAERAAVRRRWLVAERLYQSAAEALEQSGYVRLAATAHECGARFFLARGLTLAAAGHLQAALSAYEAWGGLAKCALLQREFGAGLLLQPSPRLPAFLVPTRHDRSPAHDRQLDMEVVLQVSQAMLAEVVLDKLVVKILLGIMQVAGASRGMLILKQEERLVLHADSAWSPPRGPTPLATVLAPERLIRYVMRTGETVRVADRATVGRWDDRYMLTLMPRSLLCFPVVQKHQTRGVVYLENGQNTDAFAADRLELLSVLSSQAAISLDNALLYGHLEDVVRERTAQLSQAHEELLRAARQSTEAQMAGGFAHEMRNVLGAARMMLGVCTQALREAAPRAAPGALTAVDEMLGDVNDAVDRAMRITRLILEYSQVGELSRPPGPAGLDAVDLATVVQKILKTLETELRLHNVDVRVDLQAGAVVLAKEEHLYSILDNLLRNARDAVCDGGCPGPRIIAVRGRLQAQRAVIEVQDSGPGIPASLQPRLFQPFVSTKGARGTGLGLGMARRLAELYGGSVQFSSVEGQGATFMLALPITTGEQVA